jgi:hypothetical protein
MDDNTAGLLLMVALIAALALCYITSSITEYLAQRSMGCPCQCAERRDEVAS